MESLPLALFDYNLPPEHIAQAPCKVRDASRLMQVPRVSGDFSHHQFVDLPDLLQSGDILVFNHTAVIAARLQLRRPSGGKVELMLCHPLGDTACTQLYTAHTWQALGKPASALRLGCKLIAPDGSYIEVVSVSSDRRNMIHVHANQPLWNLVCQFGHIPLPPYITRNHLDIADAERYQSVFAQVPGAIAAPTASLHFTTHLLDTLQKRGIDCCNIVLHVGPGTFLPVRREHEEDVRAHTMHQEWYHIPDATIARLRQAQKDQRRIIAVGTTALRAIETWHSTGITCGESSLFIYPGYHFGMTQGLITNFHVPRSTLLMLVAAFSERTRILSAYQEAITQGYRFFSYGDAMLLL